MRIGVDARPLCSGPGGVWRLVDNFLRSMAAYNGDHEYFLYAHRDFHLADDTGRLTKKLTASVPFLPGTLAMLTQLPRLLRDDGVEVLWATSQVLPYGMPRRIKTVLLACDLVWLLYPETMGTYNRLVHLLFARRSLERADRLVTISEAVKSELQEHIGIPAEKIAVVYPGVDSNYRPMNREEAARRIHEKYGTSRDYICSTCTLEPRKNLVLLLDAVHLLSKRGGCRHQLLVAGAAGWNTGSIFRKMEELGLREDQVRFLGVLPEEDMRSFYAGAALFVLPSLYEGFGIPVVEAMACGAPVVVSDASALVEVSEGAGLVCSAHDSEDLANAIQRILADSNLRERLSQNSLQRASAFSWETSSKKLLSVLEAAAAA